MRVEWWAGPLDGCVKEVEIPAGLWLGPDPSEPDQKVVAYRLEDGRYVYDREQTERTNRSDS